MVDPVKASFEALRQEAEVRQRVEAEQALSQTVARINDVDSRWDEEQLRELLTPVIVDLLREAGREQPEAMARSIAPHIVGTVRSEIQNSEKEIIDALTPKLGKLIREAVASAVEELQTQVDSALPLDRWIAQIQARLTGAPALGMLLDEAEPFQVHEAMLIERGSGSLLAHERPGAGDSDSDPASSEGASDEDLLSGMIAAIDSFAADAMPEETGGALRRIDTERGTVLLRASATRILALRASGEPSAEVEERLDLLLETILERSTTQPDAPILPAKQALSSALEEKPKGAEVSAFAMIAQCVCIFTAIGAAIWGHFAVEDARRDRFVHEVEHIVQSTDGIPSYPVHAAFDDDKIAVKVEGLAPDQTALSDMKAGLEGIVPLFPITLRVVVAGERLSE